VLAVVREIDGGHAAATELALEEVAVAESVRDACGGERSQPADGEDRSNLLDRESVRQTIPGLAATPFASAGVS